MRVKLDQEKAGRQAAENAKLEMEKKRNELLVDLDQIRSQSSKLANDLRSTRKPHLNNRKLLFTSAYSVNDNIHKVVKLCGRLF